MIRSVCVYCASSRRSGDVYRDAARQAGRVLAAAGIEIVTGGGASGLMGEVADAALTAGGRVIGILPAFMDRLEWGHCGLSELRVVGDMHERKAAMMAAADAFVALPGGCGTLEELLECLTWKRLGLHTAPVAMVNTAGFFQPLVTMLERTVTEGFMDERHRRMWTVVDEPARLVTALNEAPPWDADARRFAVPS